MRNSKKSWNVPASSFSQNTFNPIRSLTETLILKPNPNKPVITLGVGDPTLSGSFIACDEVIEAVSEVLQSKKFNGYAASTGHEEAKATIAEYYNKRSGLNLTSMDIILCSGCSSALDICISVLVNPMQNILIPRPGFSLYKTLAKGFGIETKEYNLLPDQHWEVDIEHLKTLIDENTAAMIVNNPSNPCGSLYCKEHLEKILEVCEEYKIPIIADEIYEYIVFEGETFHPIASLANTVPILSCSGLGKRFLIPGWRIGWITINDKQNVFEEVRKGLLKICQRIMGCNTLIQGALPKILLKTPELFFNHYISRLQKNAKLATYRISRIPGLHPFMPQAAMYMMIKIEMEYFDFHATDKEFIKKLFEEQSVFCLPCECFNYPGYFRIILAVSEEILIEMCDRLEEFCLEHLLRTERVHLNLIE